jgi:hypothetical protein
MNKRLVVVVKRLDDKYQAQLRLTAGSNILFFSRREGRASAAKRAAEELFGPLEWGPAPDVLTKSEPECLQVAYFNWGAA